MFFPKVHASHSQLLFMYNTFLKKKYFLYFQKIVSLVLYNTTTIFIISFSLLYSYLLNFIQLNYSTNYFFFVLQLLH